MDYEKEYNEALEKARIAYNKLTPENTAVKKLLEESFPELKESEDERIRKWIYSLVENLGYPADEDAEKELEEMQPLALAYLEKQKEIPMPNSTELIEMWHNAKAMLKEKDFRNDPWRLAYNAFLCGFGRGIAVKAGAARG